MGDLNADIIRLSNPRDQEVTDLLESIGFVDLLGHFCHHLQYCHLNTGWQVRQGILLIYLYYCALGSDRRLFETVGIQDP